MCNKCLVIGDFNLDYSRVNDVNYHNKLLFNDFEDALSEFELNQVVNCTTWSRLVGTVLKKSTLDHVYVKDPTTLSDITFSNPCFGDHVLIEFKVNAWPKKRHSIKQRDWRNYSKERLTHMLSRIDWNIDIIDVQQYWNVFENKLINVVDEIVPLVEFAGNVIKEKPPRLIKNKINKRN